ncbi:hypothetical protein AB1K42_14225 [Roseibium algicola]|uniref:hypothetical protein n=1 Tax=Roseibium algicola TaxID=2857014 RepID=UPI003459B7A9
MKLNTERRALTPDAAFRNAQDLDFEGFDAFVASAGDAFDSNFSVEAYRFVNLPTLGRSLSEEEYRKSRFYREAIPYDEGMTTFRAAALAENYDRRAIRQQRLERSDTTGVQTFGMLAGGAADPLNFIPVAGPVARVAGVARATGIAGRAAFQAFDAAANTAIFGALTSGMREAQGVDTSWQTYGFEIASAAFVGGVFGAAHGGALKLKARQARVALKEAETAQRMLDDAVTGLAEDGTIRLDPKYAAHLAKVSEQSNPANSPHLFKAIDADDLFRETPTGRVVDTRAGAIGEFETELRNKVLEGNPELRQELDNAQAAFQSAQDQVEAIEGPLEARSIADSVGLVDEVTGQRVAQIEAELSGNIPGTRRRELIAERDSLLDNIGRDVIDRAETDYRIGPTKRAKQARKKLATKRRKLASVQRSVDSLARTDFETSRTAYQPKTDVTPAAAPDIEPRQISELRAMADEFGIAEDGSFPEEAEIELMVEQGRLLPEDARAIAEADEIAARTKNYNQALEQAAICELG